MDMPALTAAGAAGTTAAQWVTALVIIGIVCGMFYGWQRKERDTRRRIETWKALIVAAPEIEHVTVHHCQPPSFCFDWSREPDLRSAVPMPVKQRGEHAA